MSNLVIGVTAIIVILYPGIPASTAAFALAFALTVQRDVSTLATLWTLSYLSRSS